MPSLSDTKTHGILEQILEELREIRKIVSEPSDTDFEAPTYVPNSPGIPQYRFDRMCSKCGLNLSQPTGVTCADPACPTGLRPTIC